MWHDGTPGLAVEDGEGEWVVLESLDDSTDVDEEPGSESWLETLRPFPGVLEVRLGCRPDDDGNRQRRRASMSARTSRQGRPTSGLLARSSRRESSSLR